MFSELFKLAKIKFMFLNKSRNKYLEPKPRKLT
eukprot:UN20979